MNSKEALQEIKRLFSKEEEKFALVEAKLVDGTVINYDLETKEIYVLGQDGVSVPAPVGEHQLESGEILVVVSEGVIDSVKEQEAPEEEVSEEEEMAEVPVDPKVAELEAKVSDLEAKIMEISDKINSMEVAASVMEKVVELSAQVIEDLPTSSSAEITKKENHFAKNHKKDSDLRFTNLQEVFTKLINPASSDCFNKPSNLFN